MTRRLVWTADHYPPVTDAGGSPESIRLLAEAVAAQGHSVTVVTPQWTDAPAHEMDHGVEVVRVPVLAHLPAGQIAAVRREVRRRASAADVLHAQDRRLLRAVVGLGRPAVLTLRDPGLLCPIATCLLTHRTIPHDCGQAKLWRTCGPEYDLLYGRPGRGARIKRAIRYRGLARDRSAAWQFQTIGFVSKGLRRVYASAGWPREATTAVLPSPVDPSVVVSASMVSRLRRCFDGPVVLYVGKPSLGKGWPAFVSAAGCLLGSRQDIHFVHVGAPRPHPLITSVGLHPRDAVATWMAAADLVVVPSVWCDALPRVALEAQALGRPVVGTKVGGIPEIVADGITGVLVEPADGEALARAIVEMLSNRERLHAMGEAARARALDRFGPERCATMVLEAYERVHD